MRMGRNINAWILERTRLADMDGLHFGLCPDIYHLVYYEAVEIGCRKQLDLIDLCSIAWAGLLFQCLQIDERPLCVFDIIIVKIPELACVLDFNNTSRLLKSGLIPSVT